MAHREPTGELEPRFSSPGATATPWADALARLDAAAVYWLSTVRPDGRPHVTPTVAVWLDGALYFCTGPSERKWRNLAHNAHCVITTGSNVLDGLDVVVEGDAVPVSDEATRRRVSEAFASKYEEPFRSVVADDTVVFAVAPVMVLGFGKGASFSQTRWRF